MKNFFIKYKDGKTETVEGKITLGNVSEYELVKDIDYTKVDYVEFDLHEDTIPSGDDGFYIVSAGWGRCENHDYGICLFKEREDCEILLRDIFMPVFGLKHNGVCQVAIVTGMATDVAQIIKIENNRYLSKVRFEIDGQVPYENIKIEMHTIDDENSDYCDIAKLYRNYQLEHGFTTVKDRLTPELKYSVESTNVRIRMAWKPVPCTIAEQTPENEPDVHVACTFDDVIRVMEAYKKAGVNKAEICLVGWNMKGHDGRWPQILPVEESIGGEAGLKKVIKRANELGYAMTCHTNSVLSFSIANNFSENDIALTKDGQKSVDDVRWGGGRSYNLCPKRAYEISMETLPEVAALGFRGMHYMDVVTATIPRECHHPDHPVNKKEAGEYFAKLYGAAREMFGSAGCECSYDYYAKNVDYTLYSSFADYSDMSAKHILCDKTIPFSQLVYHGIIPYNPYARCVNYAISDSADDMLKVIEYGGKPQMYYYAKFVTDTSDWIGKGDFHCNTDEEIEFSAIKLKETADAYDELSYLQYEFMEKHKEISPGVFEIEYSDKSVITVDYNNKTYKLDKGSI